jgi:hypothetical protein
MKPDPEFVALVRDVVTLSPEMRLDHLIAAYAENARLIRGRRSGFRSAITSRARRRMIAGIVRIHFRNRFNTDAHGPLHASKVAQRRADLDRDVRVSLTGTLAGCDGDQWRVMALQHAGVSPAVSCGLWRIAHANDWAAVDAWAFDLGTVPGVPRGRAKPEMVERFKRGLDALDVTQPWLSFPYQVLATTAPLTSFRREYGV